MNRVFAEQGYDFDGVPFSPAAGAINGRSKEEIAAKILDVARSSGESVKWGSLTFNDNVGHADSYDPVFYHNVLTGQSVNSIGLSNIGHIDGLELQKELQPKVEEYEKPLIPSFSPAVGEDPLEVLPAMAAKFAEAGVRIIEVNYSCPNKMIEGGAKREPILGHDLEMMAATDERIVQEVGEDITVLRKLPPYVAEKKVLIPEVGEIFARARGRVAIVGSNTIGGQKILTELGDPALGVPENLGGLSGPATREVGRDQLKHLREALPGRVAIFSALGVDSGEEVFERVDNLHADSTEGVTIFWENERRHRISFGQTVDRVADQYGALQQIKE